VDEAIDDFLTTCALRELSPGTLRGYSYDLRRLRRFLAARERHDVEQVTPSDLRAFLTTLGVGASARARYRASMRSLFHFLTAEGAVRRDPSLAVPTVTQPHHLPRPVAADQVLGVLAAVDDLALRYLFTLVAETGVRISEAIHLQVGDVHLADAPEESSVRVLGKGRRERVIPLLVAPLSLTNLPLALEGRPAGPVFGRTARPGSVVRPYTYDGVRVAWRQACAVGGVGPVHIHQLRHTFASRLVAAGVPIVTVQKLPGHQSLDTTMRYAAVTDRLVRRDLQSALDRVVLPTRPATAVGPPRADPWRSPSGPSAAPFRGASPLNQPCRPSLL
jgi:site-specific recombinase XerD